MNSFTCDINQYFQNINKKKERLVRKTGLPFLKISTLGGHFLLFQSPLTVVEIISRNNDLFYAGHPNSGRKPASLQA